MSSPFSRLDALVEGRGPPHQPPTMPSPPPSPRPGHPVLESFAPPPLPAAPNPAATAGQALAPPPVHVAPNPAARVAQRGRVSGASNYTVVETMHLLSILEEIVPVDSDEWQKVTELHNARYPGRTLQSLRRKFTTIHRKEAPTGDPNIPEDILLAKEVHKLIGDKALIGGSEEIYDMVGNGSFVNTDGTQSEVPSVASLERRANNSNVISPGRAGGRPDFASMFMMQMQAERTQRSEERRERQEDRVQMQQMFATIAAGFSGRKKKRKRRRSHESSSSSSSSSDDSDN